MYAAHGANVVLVCERTAAALQQPVIDAAEQYGLEVRLLEQASDVYPRLHRRDEEARHRLRAMVLDEPRKVFVVCYGDDHRVSLQAVLRDAELPCTPVVLTPRPGMLADAIRVAGLGIQDHVFRYRDGTYFVPIGTYGAILNSPALDAVVAREQHGAAR